MVESQPSFGDGSRPTEGNTANSGASIPPLAQEIIPERTPEIPEPAPVPAAVPIKEKEAKVAPTPEKSKDKKKKKKEL